MTDTITLSGDCSLRAIAAAHATLRDGFRQGTGGVVVDLAEVEEVDVTFIQLMLSAARTAAAADRAFSAVNVPAPIAARFAGAGVEAMQFAARA